MAEPWEAQRRRAETLRERYPFAAEVLGLYLALLDVWADAWELTRAERPERLAPWAAEHVAPGVVKATEAAGPSLLATAVAEVAVEPALAGWLGGADLPPVERYLARATLWSPLCALGPDAAHACAEDPAPRGGRRCPTCGGPPQVSVRAPADDPLVSGRRDLRCARCGQGWHYSASACPSCGETTGAKRTVYAEPRGGPIVGRPEAPAAEPALFPHLRIDACATCQHYLLDIDPGRDPRAVPEVDELAALPLDLYAAEHGLSKITANLMGF